MVAVWRDGRKQSIDSSMIVPGDMSELASGDKIPADIGLYEEDVGGVDESLLTGESTPVDESVRAFGAVVSERHGDGSGIVQHMVGGGIAVHRFGFLAGLAA